MINKFQLVYVRTSRIYNNNNNDIVILVYTSRILYSFLKKILKSLFRQNLLVLVYTSVFEEFFKETLQ